MEKKKKTNKEKLEKAYVEKDAFRELASKVMPLLEEVSDLLIEAGVKGMTGVSIGEEGYINFNPYNIEWEVHKINKEGKATMVLDMRESYEL
jgi:hypothetical protein